MKSWPEYTERRPLNRHEVQAESKIFRSRIVGKSSYPYWGIGNNVVTIRWFYKDRHVKELLTAGRVTENGAYKQSGMDSNIVDTMRCYFQNDKGEDGRLGTFDHHFSQTVLRGAAVPKTCLSATELPPPIL